MNRSNLKPPIRLRFQLEVCDFYCDNLMHVELHVQLDIFNIANQTLTDSSNLLYRPPTLYPTRDIASQG